MSGTLMLILVVEDEGLIAFAVEWALKLAGHDILGPVDSVEDAIRLARASRPDLALIDLNLRDDGDGVDVARFLHERYQTPCFFLSAQVMHARANRNIAWGLMRKPYDTASLPAIVRYVSDVLQGKPPAQPPPEIELFRPPQV
jgi:DNA-binding response OmpR family regulator